MYKERLKELNKICIDVRRDCIKTQKAVGSGHLGGSFSAMEIMVYLYFEKMNVNTENPYKEDRDVFIISKGHASLGYYAVLGRRGYFPLEELKTYRHINSRLQGHTHIDCVPGVEVSTGSLGQGLSYGIGLALGYKKRGFNSSIYVMIGDGEMEEGQIWEAFLLQSHLKLDNLVTIIDNNKLQLDGFSTEIVGLNNMNKKMESFDFNSIEIDGNDFQQIERAFNKIEKGQANIIISNTVKGKGISFMENKVEWHSKKVDDKEYITALKELDEKEGEING